MYFITVDIENHWQKFHETVLIYFPGLVSFTLFSIHPSVNGKWKFFEIMFSSAFLNSQRAASSLASVGSRSLYDLERCTSWPKWIPCSRSSKSCCSARQRSSVGNLEHWRYSWTRLGVRRPQTSQTLWRGIVYTWWMGQSGSIVFIKPLQSGTWCLLC